MTMLLNHLDLVANLSICALCFALGFFVSAVLAEARHFKFQKDQMKEEIAVAGASGRSGEDAVEIERLHAEVTSQLDAMKMKDREIEKLIEQLNRETEEHHKLEAQLNESFSEKGEVGRLRSELNVKSEGFAEKERELMRLQEERRAMEERFAQAEKVMSDYGQFEKLIQEQKKSFYEIDQRIREMKIKLRVISEKAKENVELIASFAEGKEFEEFRKSIHLDELTQKYEDQIKDLKKTD